MKVFISDKAMSMEEMIPYLKEAIVNLVFEIDSINKRIDKIIQPKYIEEGFYEELVDIKKIGKETAEDIIAIYPNRESLINDLKSKKKIPFRNDIVKLLEKKYVK